MLKLRDIMTRELVTLSPEHSLREAMSILSSRPISGAPVVTNGKVVGVVSLTDLAGNSSQTPLALALNVDCAAGEVETTCLGS